MSGEGSALHVAQLIESLEAGGAEALAVEIAGELSARGHVSHLIVARGDGPFESKLAPAVSLHDLNRPRRDGNQIFRIVYFLETCRRLERLLRSNNIEVLHTHLPKANFLGLFMAWRGVCRVYPTVHNNREFDYGDSAGGVKRRLRRFLYRKMLDYCSATIAVSDRVKDSLAAELGLSDKVKGRIHVVRNGVRVHAPAVEAERAVHRDKWGIAADQTLIIGVGRLTPQKNFAALIDAVASLDKTHGNWCCVIAGEGELRHELEALILQSGLSDKIRLPGLVEDMRGLMAAADIFCLPSLFEGLPLVMLEAMSARLPIVASRIDGVDEVISDGVEGFLISLGDAEGFASAFRSLMDDPVQKGRFGAAARALAASQYGFGDVVSRLEAEYRS